jgi:hypothetical protein
MKKILTILVIVSMVCIAVPSVLAGDTMPYSEGCGVDGCNPAFKKQTNPGQTAANIGTTAMVGSGGSGIPGEEPGSPHIKCKWEYDQEVIVDIADCEDCTYYTEGCYSPNTWEKDACPCLEGLQVKPDLGQEVMVGYYAVVSDDNGIDDIKFVYADVWHPDGEFKYQVVMEPVGFNELGEYSDVEALSLWDKVLACHEDLITINDAWATTLPSTTNATTDIREELDQEEAYLYYGESPISYCQPGGWYSVGVTAFDTANHQSSYLYNRFWYIPVAAVDIDFNNVNYGSIEVGVRKQAGGDLDLTTTDHPTVRNIGNTRVELFVEQDDMDFGTDTDGIPNVHYEARMGGDGTYVTYDPEIEVKIPGILDLCTLDKLDFRITTDKGTNGVEYTGTMLLKACIHMNSYIWDTPADYVGDAPGGVAQNFVHTP